MIPFDCNGNHIGTIHTTLGNVGHIRSARELNEGRPNRLIDYAVYHPLDSPTKKTPILLICGWSSGWTGIRLLGIFLALNGHMAIIPSVPGYGDSFTPPKEKWSQNGFEKEAFWIHQFWGIISQENDWSSFYFVGHSTGCQIGGAMAKKWPEKVSKMIFLSPSGLEKIPGFWKKLCFARRFFWSAFCHDRAFKSRDNQALIRIWDQSAQHEAGAFRPRLRRQQRWDEFKRLCRDELSRKIMGPDFPVPGENILIITGTRDSVFGKVISEQSEVLLKEFGTKVEVIEGGYHNLTKLLADEVAREITAFLDD